jgi:hypothetical protein
MNSAYKQSKGSENVFIQRFERVKTKQKQKIFMAQQKFIWGSWAKLSGAE